MVAFSLDAEERAAIVTEVVEGVLAQISVVAENGGNWMGTAEAAEFLGISEHALAKICADRAASGIPFSQAHAGAKRWFKPVDLDAWRRRSY